MLEGSARGAKIRGCTTLMGHKKEANFELDFVPLSPRNRGARAPMAPPLTPALCYEFY